MHAAATVSEPTRPGLRQWAAHPRTGGVLALAAGIALLPLVLSNNYFYEIAILFGRLRIRRAAKAAAAS